MQDYLRLVSRDRDATTMRSLLGQDDIARALEVLAGPFVELLKRTYKVGNSAGALTSLQRFIDQLIISEDLPSPCGQQHKDCLTSARSSRSHRCVALTHPGASTERAHHRALAGASRVCVV